MTTNDHEKIARQIAELSDLTVNQLQKKWEEVWQQPCRSRHKDNLRKRIAWKIQANAYGGLSQRALARAAELADETLLKIRDPGGSSPSSGLPVVHRFGPRRVDGMPLSGSVLTRDYRGKKLLVKVLDSGFEFEGQVYKSLSAIAKVATGSHWNGLLFFGLKKSEKEAA